MKLKLYTKIILSIVLLGIIGFILKPKNGSPLENVTEEPSAYKTILPQKILYAEEISSVGILSNKDEYQLSFMVGGIISYLKVDEGEKVNEGEVLAKINQTSVEVMTERLSLAYEKAERDFKRAEALYQDKVITLEDFQNAKTGLENTRLQLEDAKFNKEYATIKAPASGIVQKILVHENEMTSAGAPVIIIGSEKKGKILKVNIADVDVVKIKLQDQCKINFDAIPDKEFSGYVSGIAGMSDLYTGTYETEVFVKDPEKLLKAGFIGKVAITSGNKKEYLQIPIEALIEADEMKGEIYILNGDKKKLRTVKILKIVGDKLLISEGINGTEQIIFN